MQNGKKLPKKLDVPKIRGRLQRKLSFNYIRFIFLRLKMHNNTSKLILNLLNIKRNINIKQEIKKNYAQKKTIGVLH